MQRVTMNGPIFLGAPLLITVSNATKKFEVDGPPDPITRPERSFETSLSSSPESLIACSMARKL